MVCPITQGDHKIALTYSHSVFSQ